jgi:hypothetical protein
MKAERFFTTNLREYTIDPSFMLHQIFVRLVFIHGGFANHGIHLFLHLIHEFFGTLAIFHLKAKSGKGHFLSRLVHVESHHFSRGPSVGNRPNLNIKKFFNNVMAAENCASQVKCIFTIPESNCPMIVRGSASGSQCFNGRAESVSWSIVARNFRHVHFHIKPIRAPVFGEVSLAARCNLNPRKSFSCILPMRVESAASVVCFVVLAVVKFDDVRLDDKLEQSCENISTKVAPEGLHNP